MESTMIYVGLALSAATLALCAYLTIKIKAILYLLEQPVVKKMSPQLKLKPVKVEELIAEKQRQQQQLQQNQQTQSQSQSPRPQSSHSHSQNGPRPQGGRSDRPDFDRNRDGNRDRGPRPDRPPEGDRNRDGNRERFRDRDRNRPQGGERRPPREANDNPRENIPAHQSEAPRMETPAPRNDSNMAPLAPRRPLPSTVESVSHAPAPIIAAPETDNNVEGMFSGEGDMQHGRRVQIKKPKRFEVDEAEVGATTEG